MLAIADGRPEVMGLKSIIKYNVDFSMNWHSVNIQHFLIRH